MGSFREIMQKKTQSFAGRFVCVMTAMIGICLLFYGCGRETSMEDTVSEESMVQASEEAGAEWDNDQEESSIREKTESFKEDDAGALEIPLLEQLFTYEEVENSSEQYLVITGIEDKYRDRFQEYLVITGIAEEHQEQYMKHMIEHKEWIDTQRKCLRFPTDVNGIPVREIGAFAFADIEMDGVEFIDSIRVVGEGAFRNTQITKLRFSANLETIGEAAFENCNLERLEFPETLSFIGNRAFADCDPDFLLCYGDDTDGKENLAAKYAGENGLNSMEIILSQTPIIHYPAEPYILQPRIGNFFYGDYEDLEEDQWCTWEEDENAPNFGYSDWQWSGCSSWCGVMDFELTAEASSELASANHLSYWIGNGV